MTMLAPFTKEETGDQTGGLWFIQGQTSSDGEEHKLWSWCSGLMRTSKWGDSGRW